jgi:hypothetical protein
MVDINFAPSCKIEARIPTPLPSLDQSVDPHTEELLLGRPFDFKIAAGIIRRLKRSSSGLFPHLRTEVA